MTTQRLVACYTTGQTPLFSDQMQEWARQHFDRKDIECYCLDAPLYSPTGASRYVGRHLGESVTQALFASRDRDDWWRACVSRVSP